VTTPRDADEAVGAMRRAFSHGGRTLLGGDPEVTPKWVAWSTPHRQAALARYVSAALREGCAGVFLMQEGTRCTVGCLNPAWHDPASDR